jgi:hypothetical protein
LREAAGFARLLAFGRRLRAGVRQVEHALAAKNLPAARRAQLAAKTAGGKIHGGEGAGTYVLRAAVDELARVGPLKPRR